MAQDKKCTLLFLSVLLIVVLINSAIIKPEYFSGSGLHWLLMLAIPLLFIMIHYARKKYKAFLFKKAAVSRPIKPEKNGLHNNNSLFISRNNNNETPAVMVGNSFCLRIINSFEYLRTCS